MAESLVELAITVVWKAELVDNELGYLAEDISKQSVEDVIWFLLTSYSKMREGRDKLRKEILSKKRAGT